MAPRRNVYLTKVVRLLEKVRRKLGQRFIIAGAYPNEALSKDGHHVQIRVIDTLTNTLDDLVYVDVLPVLRQ